MSGKLNVNENVCDQAIFVHHISDHHFFAWSSGAYPQAFFWTLRQQLHLSLAQQKSDRSCDTEPPKHHKSPQTAQRQSHEVPLCNNPSGYRHHGQAQTFQKELEVLQVCSREGCFGPTSFHGLAPCVVHSHHMLFSEDYNPVSGGYILLLEGFFLDYYTPFLEDCNNQGYTSS